MREPAAQISNDLAREKSRRLNEIEKAILEARYKQLAARNVMNRFVDKQGK
jgi:hypothetical protein